MHKHIRLVQFLMHKVLKDLMDRCDRHDISALTDPNVDLDKEHSYRPGFHESGVLDMSLIDLVELFVDRLATQEDMNKGLPPGLDLYFKNTLRDWGINDN